LLFKGARLAESGPHAGTKAEPKKIVKAGSKRETKSAGLGLPLGPDDEFQKKSDFHDLERAHEIMSDKPRHRAARHYGKQRMKIMARLVSGK
jgi:hypothetical protein